MADPFRLRVLKKLTEVLEGITPANGYEHDLTGKVFRGRDTFGHKDPIPMVSILESVDNKSWLGLAPDGPVEAGAWELLIQGFVEDDDTHPTDPAYRLLAEVKKCLTRERKERSNILGFNAKVDKLSFSSGVVRPADEVSDKAYFWLKLELKVVENHEDPYL